MDAGRCYRSSAQTKRAEFASLVKATLMAAAEHPETPAEALEALMEGNRRHCAGELTLRDHSPVPDRSSGQQPFAAVIACADSRVSPTLGFDLERGNIFCSRVAGNIIETGALAGTEFAVSVLGVKLVMVLGHTDCGAVKNAMAAVEGQEFPESEYGRIGSLIGHITPVIERLPADGRSFEDCVAANAREQARLLAATGPIVAPAVAAGELAVAAGVYDVGSGRVTLLD